MVREITDHMKPFETLRVTEIVGSPAGAYTAKLFADQGARVIRIEPPGGDPSRTEGEALWDGLGPRFSFLNTSKRAIILDLSDAAGRSTLHGILEATDVVVESSAPERLEPASRDLDIQHLVKTYISPLGLDGPSSNLRSNEFTDEALGGHLFLNGEPHREPIHRPGSHSHFQAGTHAFIGAIAALLVRDRTGRGQTVETSHVEGLASLHQYTSVMWTQGGFVLRRVGNTQGGHWHPVGVYPCKDGYVCLAMPVGVMLQPFLDAAGLGHLMEDPRFADDFVRGQHKAELDAALRPWLLEHTAEEIIELGQKVAGPVGPVPTMLEILDDPHFLARHFWRRVGDRFPLLYPRGPFRIDAHSSRLTPPTRHFESPEAVLAELGEAHGPSPQTASEPGPGMAPLQGIRVLDLTRVWAGPLATRMLADLGADVIKVEASWARGPAELPPEAGPLSHLFPEEEVGEEPYNREVSFNKLNRNKRSLTLDLDTPRGRELFEALVRRSDVVIENYSPRVMGKLGLGWDRLQELNPSLVYVAMPGFGSSGPYRDWLAFGPLIEAASGLTRQMGYGDSGPYRSGLAWPDPVTSLHAVAATLIALVDRESHPERKGRQVEVAMIEAMTSFNGDEILAAQLRRRPAPRCGNHDRRRAPQGCYPCAGDDAWLAISVTSDEEWQTLCAMACLEERYLGMGLEERRNHHEEIDARLGAWTREQEAETLMAELQAHGVIAAVVRNARQLAEDPHLEERRFWVQHDHRVVGRRTYPGLPIRLSETPPSFRRAAPCLGEHNREVLCEILGLSDDDVDGLEARGVLVDRPPPDATFRGVQRTSHLRGSSAESSRRSVNGDGAVEGS